MRVAAIIASGGVGKRISSAKKKQFLSVNDKPLLAHSIYPFQECKLINEIVIVAPKEEVERTEEEIVKANKYTKVSSVVTGGEQRQDSVYNGLLALKKIPDYVCIHDGVRPFVKIEQIEQALDAAKPSEALIFAFPVRNTIKEADKSGRVNITLARDKLWEVCTPQIFSYKIIMDAHKKALKDQYYATDDAALVERMNKEVKIFHCSATNIKVTHPVDVKIAQAIMADWSY